MSALDIIKLETYELQPNAIEVWFWLCINGYWAKLSFRQENGSIRCTSVNTYSNGFDVRVCDMIVQTLDVWDDGCDLHPPEINRLWSNYISTYTQDWRVEQRRIYDCIAVIHRVFVRLEDFDREMKGEFHWTNE